MPGVEPTAEERAAVEAGAMTVKGAEKHTGMSRSELYLLMRDGVLIWFPYGDRGDRYITRDSINDFLAALLAAHNATKTQRTK